MSTAIRHFWSAPLHAQLGILIGAFVVIAGAVALNEWREVRRYREQRRHEREFERRWGQTLIEQQQAAQRRKNSQGHRQEDSK